MPPPIRFGALGVANITPRALVHPVDSEPRATIWAVAARDRARAEAFAAHEHIRTVADGYQAVIDNPDINAIYNPLPISLHHEWTLKALAAGKHVLCEKSFACNADEAREMADAARDASLVLMDAFHYRYHPIFIKTVELLRSGAIGQVEDLDASSHTPVTDPDSIRLDYALGGGVTMDLGCYPIHWVRHAVGEEPEVFQAEAETGPPDVDLMLKAKMRFPSGAIASISGDMREGVAFNSSLTVTGSEGKLHLENPIVPQRGHRLEVETAAGTETIELDRRPTYGYQIDAFIAAVLEGAPLLTDAEDAVKQMTVIDACYAAAGLPRRGLER